MKTTQFAEYNLSRLMLGTVQFGLPYGIANRTGQPEVAEVRRIIELAYEGGVNCLDTARAYGASEEVLGRVLHDLGLADKLVVVTKVAHLAAGLDATMADALVEESVSESLRRLRLDVLPIVLFHIEDNYCYIESLLKLQQRGLVRHVGCSTMTPAATQRIVASGLAEAVQIPTSLLDQRFIRSDTCSQAAQQGVALFVRSVYLQGLILMQDEDIIPELAEVTPVLQRLRALAAEAGVGLAELAVRYVLSIPGVTCALAGVETLAQMQENLAWFSRGPLAPDLLQTVEAAVPDLPDRILMPNLWSKRMPDARRRDRTTRKEQT